MTVMSSLQSHKWAYKVTGAFTSCSINTFPHTLTPTLVSFYNDLQIKSWRSKTHKGIYSISYWCRKQNIMWRVNVLVTYHSWVKISYVYVVSKTSVTWGIISQWTPNKYFITVNIKVHKEEHGQMERKEGNQTNTKTQTYRRGFVSAGRWTKHTLGKEEDTGTLPVWGKRGWVGGGRGHKNTRWRFSSKCCSFCFL